MSGSNDVSGFPTSGSRLPVVHRGRSPVPRSADRVPQDGATIQRRHHAEQNTMFGETAQRLQNRSLRAFVQHDVLIPKDLPEDQQKCMRTTRKIMMRIYMMKCSPSNRPLSPHRGRDDIETRSFTLSMLQSDLKTYADKMYRLIDAGEISKEQADYSIISAYGAYVLGEAERSGDDIMGANCGEHADMGFVLIARLENNPSVDRMSLDKQGLPEDKQPDHAFLVLNRDQNTDPGDYKTWNKEAFVLDIYVRAIYPASQFHEKLVAGQPAFSKGQSKTVLRAHHPKATEFVYPENLSEMPNRPVDLPIPATRPVPAD